MNNAVSPIPAGMTQETYDLIRRALFDASYGGPHERATTVIHTARGWTLARLAALTPPFAGARMQFIIKTSGTASGFANLGWNPVVGDTAAQAFARTNVAITRLQSVIYQRAL